MSGINQLINQEVEVEISGKNLISGLLLDKGLDIIVIYTGNKFLYIPLLHIQHLKEKVVKEIVSEPPESLLMINEPEPISYRKILNHAKGQFIELFVTGNKSIHGYITSVLNDYIVFYSPVYKIIFISMQHIKWFTPYSNQLTPYTLGSKELPIVPASIPLARSFDEQLKKYEGQLIVLDLGDNPEKIGLLKNVSNNIIELITANGQAIYWKFTHIKTANLP